MSEAPAPATAANSNHLTLFGPPPLIEGEDLGAFNVLLARISTAVKPADILEEIWVSDIVNLTWEVSRWRRLKVTLIATTECKGIEAILQTMVSWSDARNLAEGWANGDADSIKEVKDRLASANLPKDAIMAQALAASLPNVACIDRMTMNGELRRNAALREIERHRANFGRALRHASSEVVDAEFEQVGALKIEDRKAA